jgi:hypothetical protein
MNIPSVVTGEKNSPTVAHAGRPGRPKWVPGAWGIAGPPCPGGYKYGGLTLQVGGLGNRPTTCHRKQANC